MKPSEEQVVSKWGVPICPLFSLALEVNLQIKREREREGEGGHTCAQRLIGGVVSSW